MLRLRVWLILLGADVRGKALREWFVREVLFGKGAQWPGLAVLISGCVLLIAQLASGLITAHWIIYEQYPSSWAELGADVWKNIWPNVVAYGERSAYVISMTAVGGLTLAECVFLRWLFV